MSNSFSGKALSFDVQVATLLGLHEAIILHQIQYWINIFEMKDDKNHFHEGRWWVYNSYRKWHENQFPFISERSIRYAIDKLCGCGVLIKGEFNTANYDKTNWYTVDEDRLAELISSDSAEFAQSIVQDLHNGDTDEEPMAKIANGGMAKIAKGGGKNCQTNTIYNTSETTTPYNNVFNGTINGTKPSKEVLRTVSIDPSETLFDPSLLPFDNTNYHGLREKVMDLCVSIGQSRHSVDLARIIVYFYKKYAETFREKHPPVNDRTMIRCLQVLTDLDDPFVDQIADSGIFLDLIDIYFAKEYKNCDYHLPHFCSHGVLGILAYDQENDRFSDVKRELVC